MLFVHSRMVGSPVRRSFAVSETAPWVRFTSKVKLIIINFTLSSRHLPVILLTIVIFKHIFIWLDFACERDPAETIERLLHMCDSSLFIYQKRLEITSDYVLVKGSILKDKHFLKLHLFLYQYICNKVSEG